MATWLSGSALVSINKVTRRQARLILGMGDRVRAVSDQPLRPTQPPTLSWTENEYRPKCGDALRLGSKGRRYGSLHL